MQPCMNCIIVAMRTLKNGKSIFCKEESERETTQLCKHTQAIELQKRQPPAAAHRRRRLAARKCI